MFLSVRWLVLAMFVMVSVTLIMSAPARLLGHILPASSIVLQGVSGSLWSGKAAGCLVRMPGGFMQLGETRWTVSPLSLMLLAPRVSLSSQWGEQRVRAKLTYLGADHLRVSDVEARIDAGLLQAFLPVSLDGTLASSLESAEIKQGVLRSMVGRVVWEDAVWLSPRGDVVLGSYAIDSKHVDSGVRAEILTLTGPLLADGLVALTHADGVASYDLTLELGSEGSMNPQLQEALSLIAPPTDSGYRLTLQGKLPPAG
ncbi:MAG: type II secretion system protein N [Halioglobus sp.]